MLSKNLDMYLYSGQGVKKQKIKNKKNIYYEGLSTIVNLVCLTGYI